MSRLSTVILILSTAGVLGVWSLYTVVPDFSLRSYFTQERIFTCVVGDIMLARNVELLMSRYGSDYPYQYQTFCPDNSNFLANFEASVPAVHKPTPGGSFSFSVRERNLPSLQQSGVTHVSLANNHTDDFGEIGMEQTATALKTVGLEPIAPYAWEIIDIGVPAAVIAVDITLVPFDVVRMREAVQAAEEDSVVQIAYVHWGPEYELLHDDTQEQAAKSIIASGADLIIGHHPHVVQDVDIVSGVPVLYSLGNYIFDQYFSDDVRQGLALRVSYEANWHIDLVPVETLSFKSAPRTMDAISAAEFLKALAERSHPALREQIQKGYIRL